MRERIEDFCRPPDRGAQAGSSRERPPIEEQVQGIRDRAAHDIRHPQRRAGRTLRPEDRDPQPRGAQIASSLAVADATVVAAIRRTNAACRRRFG